MNDKNIDKLLIILMIFLGGLIIGSWYENNTWKSSIHRANDISEYGTSFLSFTYNGTTEYYTIIKENHTFVMEAYNRVRKFDKTRYNKSYPISNLTYLDELK